MAVLHDGQRLGAYEVRRLLGMGGMAEVYLGIHVALERDVAIKVLSPALNADPTFPLRFRREAKTVARLSHRNIITVYDFGEEGDLAYLVMELATDGTFEERAAQVRTLGQIVEELAPICDALHYAHTQGVVHRDLKPENILLSDHERKLLADFGLARIRSETLDISEAGVILGTPHYMAPEQIMGEEVDQRADVYALGVMVYQLLTGEMPFNGQTFFAIAQQHLKTPVPSIRELLPDAPTVLDNACRRALAKNPRNRYPDVPAFFADLRRAAAEAPDLLVGSARPVVAGRSHESEPAPNGEDDADVSSTQRLALCAACGRMLQDGDNFCRGCGTPRAPFAARQPAAVSVAAGQPAAPAPSPATAPPAPAPLPSSRRRRPTSFAPWQWTLLAGAAVAVLFINLTGFWLWHAGRGAGEDGPLASVTTYVYDNLPAFKSGMSIFALLFAGFAVFAMRSAVVDDRHLGPTAYRRFRQWHRLAGYAALTTAFAIGLFTCIGLFGFAFSSPRVALHTVFGTALLALLVVKVAVVRFIRGPRRYLDLIGQSLLALFLLVFLTSTVPYLWERFHSSAGGYYANPRNGAGMCRDPAGDRSGAGCEGISPDFAVTTARRAVSTAQAIDTPAR